MKVNFDTNNKDLLSLIEIVAKEENVQVLKAAYIRMQVVY